MSRAISLLAIVLLCACAQKEPEPYATGTQPDALMAVAFPGWKDGNKLAKREIGGDGSAPQQEVETVFFGATFVVKLSDERVALVVSGTPEGASHVSSGVLG